MSKRRPNAVWTDLSVADFRVLVDRIDSASAASALCTDIGAAVQRVSDDLAADPETDAERHPRVRGWRRRAVGAKMFLENKLAIVASRTLALGGITKETFAEISEKSATAVQARRQAPPQTVVDLLRAIVSDVAARDPLVDDGDGRLQCAFCDALVAEHEPLADHVPECPWRRAVEEIEQFPVREAPAPTLTENQIARAAEKVVKTSVKERIAALDKKLAKQVAHGQRMSNEREAHGRLFRVALREVMRYREDPAVAALIREIEGVSPRFVDPAFWDKDVDLAWVRAVLQSPQPDAGLDWFPDHLREWTDFDVASYTLAEALGLVEVMNREEPIPHKGVFWSANPVGDGLTRILHQLVEMGALEMNEEGKYRVRAGFKFAMSRKVEEGVKFGVRVTNTNWATVNGGHDLVGTRVEMEAKIAEWRAQELPSGVEMHFEIVPYTGDDPQGEGGLV